MGNETSKATRRRGKEAIFLNIIAGKTIDIGCGTDPLNKKDFPNITELITFDKVEGDANYLDKYFENEIFDCLHHSNVLEHLYDPYDVIVRWFKLIKKGGYMIGLIPDYVLYEHKHWPSLYNDDHKHSFSIDEEWPENQNYHIKVIDLIKHLKEKFPNEIEVLKLELIDTFYDYDLKDVDQTRDKAEAFIEFILQRKK